MTDVPGVPSGYKIKIRALTGRPRMNPPLLSRALPGTDEIGVFQSTCSQREGEEEENKAIESKQSSGRFGRSASGVQRATYPSLIRCGFLACITMNASTTVGQQSYRHGVTPSEVRVGSSGNRPRGRSRDAPPAWMWPGVRVHLSASSGAVFRAAALSGLGQ